MIVILTMLSVFVAGCAATPRIVNGTNAAPGEIPYIVSLRYFKSHICGASILDATHVLTAAHCVDGRGRNPSTFSIQYGVLKVTRDDTNAIAATKIVTHPQYSPLDSYKNDVAVINLASEIPIGGNIGVTHLPNQCDATVGNQAAVLSGWGFSYSGSGSMKNLQRVDIKLYTNEDCESAYKGRTNRDYHVCAGIPEGGKGQCSADSGGPLTVGGVQVGIVSWSKKPCTPKGYPGVFVRVASYVDWIREQMV